MADSNLKFSLEAKQVYDAAYSFARFFGHNQLKAEHLLLGLLKTPQCEASLALNKLGVKPHHLGDKLRKEILVTKSDVLSAETITKSAEIEAIELLALKEAEKQEVGFISTLHLLHAILSSQNLQANKWLHYHGITLDEFHNMPTPTRGWESLPLQNPDYFSGPVKTILVNAQMVASQYKQDTATTSHVLLGILKTPESNAFKQLSRLIEDVDVLSENLTREISSCGESSSSDSKLNLGNDLKMMLLSAANASKYGSGLNCIDSRLILLGIVEQDKTPAARLLAKSSVTLEQLRNQPRFVREYPSRFSTKPDKKLSVFSSLRRWFRREK